MSLYSICEEGFFFCKKPAIWISPSYSVFEELYFDGYPYITKKQFHALEDHEVIFFQNEHLRQQALDQYIRCNEDCERFSPTFHRIVGTILGFPPRAVDFFVQYQHDPRLKRYRIGMKYCGVECIGSICDLADNAAWLWERYPYPDLDILTIDYDDNRVCAEYGDIQRVKKLARQLADVKLLDQD